MKIIYFLALLGICLYAKEPITPIPIEVKVNKYKANLGKELFFDPRLSKDDTISCHTCHMLDRGGVDNLKVSLGVEGRAGKMNAPTVFNAAYNFVQFWDGRARTLHSQVFGPIEDPNEMAIALDELVKKLNKTEYKSKFKKIYKDGITKDNIADAIAEYEKTLITPHAPFDKYLKGEEDAISKEAKRGYIAFKEQGCIVCHHGINVGGNMYSKFGVMEESHSEAKGRYDVTKNEDDLYYFKVPTLRNIELTAPYLHDGRYDNLRDTVKFMANYQLGKSLNERDIDDIIAFLQSLTGELYEHDAKK